MSQQFTLYIVDNEGERHPVTVTRKRVKNLNLRFSNGVAKMSIPLRASETQVQAFLSRHEAWLLERMRRHALIERQRSDVESAGFTPQTTVTFWGQSVAVRQMLGDGLDALTKDELRARVNERYKTEVMRALPSVYEPLERAMGVHATRWSVRSMKTRWGSCTPKTAAIRIALQLAAYPPECLRMVVAHELVHLIEPSHNARFHMLLDAYCPDNRDAARLLRKAPLDAATQTGVETH